MSRTGAARRLVPAAVALGAVVAAAAPGGQPGGAAARPAVRPVSPAAAVVGTSAAVPIAAWAAVPIVAAPTPHPPTPTRATSTAPMPPAAPAAAPAPVDVGPVFAVGDSVTIDISGDLQRNVAGTTVDGKVGREFSAGIDIVDGLRRAGRLPPTVVVALGTNGTITAQEFDAMMRAAAGATRIVFVSVRVPRSWQDGDNSVLRTGVASHGGTRLADWYALSAGHPEWFAPDGYHLTPSGSRALAQLIATVLAG